MSATRHLLPSTKLIVGIIGLCFAFTSANQFNISGDVIPRPHSKPQLLSTHNQSALTANALKSHNVPEQYKAADGISDEEPRLIKEIVNALSPIINKLQGIEPSGLTEPLLQTDVKMGDKTLVTHLQSITKRTEAQDSHLLAMIERFRASEDPSDKTFGDIQYIQLLTDPQSAGAIYSKWSDNKETPLTAIKRMDRSFSDSSLGSSLQKFFKPRSALPWLSFVGYCWKQNKNDFTAENLFQYFETARLDEKAMADLLYNARDVAFGQVVFDKMQQFLVVNPSTRALAFRIEMMVSGLTDYSNFWQMLVEQTEQQHLKESPLDVWLEYVAYCLSHAG